MISTQAAAHHHPGLVAPRLDFVVPRLATLAALVLKRVVDLGPFKHTVDDGLPLRKAALTVVGTLVDTKHADAKAFVPVVAAALGDKSEDVAMMAHMLLAKLCAAEPAECDAHADAILEPLAVPKRNLQPDFNVIVFECFDTSSSAGLRELDESDRSVQKSAESTLI